MKKISVYLLIFLLYFVYTSESVRILARALGDKSAYTWMDKIDCSENSAESEKSKEQKEKIEFLGHYIPTQLNLARKVLAGLNFNHCINFPSFEYSQTIYSPPEYFA